MSQRNRRLQSIDLFVYQDDGWDLEARDVHLLKIET